MGLFSRIGNAVDPRKVLDPRKALKSLDPRNLKSSIDPRQAARGVFTGRIPGASLLPGASALMPGTGMSLMDRLRAQRGDPNAIAKAVLSTAESSSSSRWAPRGLARGMGAQVASIASVTRAGLPMSAVSKLRLARWF